MNDEKNYRRDHNWRLLELILEDTRTYHDHKETMAHLGLLVQISFFGWMSSTDNWLKESCVWGIPFFIFIWLLIHIFIRWQLRNRRWAAITIEAVEKTLKKWADPPQENEKPDICTNMAKPRKCCFDCLKPRKIIIDYLVPCPKASLDSDIKKDIWPHDLVKKWKKQKKMKTGALSAEWFLFIGSITILVLGILSLIFGK